MACFTYQNTWAWYICPKCFLQNAGKPNNYLFYLQSFLNFKNSIAHTLLRPSQFLEELLEIFLMVHFAEISQVSPPYWIFQHVGRVATLKLVQINCLRDLQTTLIMVGRGLVSKFVWDIVDFNQNLIKLNILVFIGLTSELATVASWNLISID